MKKELAELLKLINVLGVYNGISIFLRIKLNRSKTFTSLSVKGVKSPVYLRKGGSDWTVFKQVFVWNEYRYPVKADVKPIIDAGANVGFASVWMANRFKQARIIALEPEKNNYKLLQKNIAAYEGITAINAGLWDKSCFLEIVHPDWGSWGFRTKELAVETENSIRATTLGEIVKTYDIKEIDILKIDIEGAETEVFKTGYECWLPITKYMFIELHDNINRNSSKEVFRALLRYDFSIDICGENIVAINNAYRN